MPNRLPLTRLLAPVTLAAMLVPTLLPALAPPAAAAEEQLARIELKDGEVVRAERFFPTYTTLVVLTPGATMRLLPNERVKSINGVPYERVYWGQEAPIYGENEVPAATGEALVEAPSREPAAVAPLLPLTPGTLRRYELSGTRTTWVRHGRKMERNATVQLTGLARETVVGADPEGPAAIRETVIKSRPGDSAEEVQILQLVERRHDGYYLVGYGVDDAHLGGDPGQASVNVPPRLWPETLSVGQTWTIGPFKRLGLYQTGRMQVVGREAVTVPAGTFPDAYKVEGFGHVFGGVANLPTGRLITDHGTLTTTTWFVPGIGPVKEERKVHLHQDFFPKGQQGFETPFVVEERTTRQLAEHQTGLQK